MANFAVAKKLLGRKVAWDERRSRLHAALDKILDTGTVRPFHGNIERLTLANVDFRRVIFTGRREQLVLMSLKPGQTIGDEVHPDTDQFFRIERGVAEFILGNGAVRFILHDGGAAVVPAGTWHDVKNISAADDLKLYTVYAPPEHPAGIVEKEKK